MEGCVPGERIDHKGYARVTVGHARHALAHRMAWIAAHGPIPKGFHLHHACENPACVNVEHLELLSPLDHGRRHRKCEHGEEDRYYSPHGQSYCRVCATNRRKGVVSHHA